MKTRAIDRLSFLDRFLTLWIFLAMSLRSSPWLFDTTAARVKERVR